MSVGMPRTEFLLARWNKRPSRDPSGCSSKTSFAVLSVTHMKLVTLGCLAAKQKILLNLK